MRRSALSRATIEQPKGVRMAAYGLDELQQGRATEDLRRRVDRALGGVRAG